MHIIHTYDAIEFLKNRYRHKYSIFFEFNFWSGPDPIGPTASVGPDTIIVVVKLYY